MDARLSTALVVSGLMLACTPPPEAATPWTPEREWVGVTSYPCAIDSLGAVECWTRADEPWPIVVDDLHGHSPIRKLAPVHTDRVVSGLTWDGDVETLSCPDHPVTGAPRLRCDVEWTGPFEDFNGFSALRDDGTVLREGRALADRWVAISDGPMGLNARHELVVMGASQGREPQVLSLDSRPQTLVSSAIFPADFNSYFGACLLEEQGRVVCAGDGPFWTDSLFDQMVDVKELSGGNGTICAQLVDDSILCHDGSIFDFGPLVAFDAYGLHMGGYFDEDARYLQEPTVCAITAANTIECEGARVDDVLREQLAEVNRRYGDPAAL